MARVEDRLTKPGRMIILKSHHVLPLRRVLTAIFHITELVQNRSGRMGIAGPDQAR